MKEKYAKFIEKLESQHTWPSVYMFKFIVPSEKREQLESIFRDEEIESKKSSKGNYISITVRMMINQTSDVIRVYEEVHEIEGVIAL